MPGGDGRPNGDIYRNTSAALPHTKKPTWLIRVHLSRLTLSFFERSGLSLAYSRPLTLTT